MTRGGAMHRARRRFFVAPATLDQDRVVFASREAHHIARVLRLQPGVRVVAFDGTREVEVALETVNGGEVTGRRLGTPVGTRRPIELALLQGVARASKMDLIVRMGTEIGLSAVYPVLTRRVVAVPEAARLDRWRRIAQEAAKQCGRADLPEIHAAAPLDEALATLGPVDLLLVPWEGEHRPIGEIIAGRPFASAAILIGPEGGLAPDEAASARAAGGETVSLGPLVLRTETAGVAAAAMLLYERVLRSPSRWSRPPESH